MNHELAFHKGLLARLIDTAAVTELVPETSILDRNARPLLYPSIVFGEDQMIEGEDLARKQCRVVSTLHVWAKGTGLVPAKEIAGAVRSAVNAGRLALPDGYHCGDCRVSSMRFLRDPDGETGHGIVTVEALISEV